MPEWVQFAVDAVQSVAIILLSVAVLVGSRRG